MLVVGSHALKAHDIPLSRVPGDFDAICTLDEYERFVERHRADIVTAYKTKNQRGFVVHKLGSKPLEFEIAYPDSTAEGLLDLAATHDISKEIDGTRYASPEVVLALKMSHRYLKNSPHFMKTRDDIFMLRGLGYSIPEFMRPWYKGRVKETYHYGHPNLNVKRADFFKDDNIQYVYVHDTLHEAVKLFSRPAYEFIKKDTAEVFCSKEKFAEAPELIKLATVVEESYVLALERHQIPNEFKPDPLRSFTIALQKVCTSIASGWWREYAWENYHRAMDLYDDRYVEKFHAGLRDGIVQEVA